MIAMKDTRKGTHYSSMTGTDDDSSKGTYDLSTSSESTPTSPTRSSEVDISKVPLKECDITPKILQETEESCDLTCKELQEETRLLRDIHSVFKPRIFVPSAAAFHIQDFVLLALLLLGAYMGQVLSEKMQDFHKGIQILLEENAGMRELILNELKELREDSEHSGPMVLRRIGTLQNKIIELQETALGNERRHIETRQRLESAVRTNLDANQKGFQMKLRTAVRQRASDWTLVYGLGRLESPNADRSLWTWGGTGIPAFPNPVKVVPGGKPKYIRRLCPKCQITHKDIIYKRLTPWPAPMEGPPFDVDGLFLNNWHGGNGWGTGNVFNRDFKLFSSFINAQADENFWTFCSFNYSDVGFPGGCGPNGHVGKQWNSMNGYSAQTDFAYYVHTPWEA